MEKRSVFNGKLLPYALLAPQLVDHVRLLLLAGQPGGLAIVPAAGRLRPRRPNSSASRTIETLFAQARILQGDGHDGWCSRSLVAVLSLSHRAAARGAWPTSSIKGAAVYKTLLIWPYAVAPAVAGVLWLFMFQPSLGILAQAAARLGIDWNPLLNGDHAMILVVLAAAWKQISYNFLFFLAGLQSIPKSVIEAAAIDGARPMRRFWTIIFPLLSPTTFFLLVVNVVYVFFDTFGIIDAMTGGGPAKATQTLVYKVYPDGRLGGDLGGSAAQSVILMVIVIGADRDPVPLRRAQGALLMVEQRPLVEQHLLPSRRSCCWASLIVAFPVYLAFVASTHDAGDHRQRPDAACCPAACARELLPRALRRHERAPRASRSARC